jgi:chemotaxis protein MotB
VRLAPALLFLAGIALSLATGCVTRGTYQEDVGRLETANKQLEKRVENLTRANSSLDAERIALADELEDLHQSRSTLERDVAKLQETKDLLTAHLREREAQVDELSKVSSTYEALVEDLESDLTAGRIQIEQLRDGIRLNLPQDVLFPSGSAKLQATGQVVIRKVAERLKTVGHRVEVQGHSDNVPVSGRLATRYGSNWELAGARASQVVRLFESEGGAPSRMIPISFGEHAPVDDNTSPEGRARNRRIEIRLIPVAGTEYRGRSHQPRMQV